MSMRSLKFGIGTEVIILSMVTSIWNPNLYFISCIFLPLIGQQNSAVNVMHSCLLVERSRTVTFILVAKFIY
jgi:hypothetical protein